MSSKTKTKAVKDETTPSLVPKLRFPEFRDAEGWKVETGNALFDQINDRNPKPGLPVLAITQEHGAIPRDLIDYNVSVTDKSIESYKVVQVGDFIISLRSFQGGIEFSRYHGICSPAYVILRRCAAGDNEYFKHYLKTDRFIRILTRNLEGLRDGKMVSYSQFSELQIPVPNPNEQQKIASCLSSLDTLITAHTQKLNALKTYKKGLMQQLFPREGETVPRLRFPEFRGAGEWEEKLGAELFRQIGERNYATELPVLAISQEHGAIPRDLIDYHVSVSDKSIESYKVVRVGDFIISLRSFQGGIEYSRYHGICSPAYVILRLQQNGSADYFRHYFKSVRFIRQLIRNLEGLRDGKMISFKQFSELCLSVPTLPEQQRIASCFTSLDDIIAARTQKLEALKTHKRGMMQGLFPMIMETEA